MKEVCHEHPAFREGPVMTLLITRSTGVLAAWIVE